MKRQIRLGVFETNSSSTHSLVICKKEIYEKFKCGEAIVNSDKKEFITVDEFKEHKKYKDFLYDLKYNQELIELLGEREYTNLKKLSSLNYLKNILIDVKNTYVHTTMTMIRFMNIMKMITKPLIQQNLVKKLLLLDVENGAKRRIL